MATMQYKTIPGVDKPVSRLVQGVNRARAQGDIDGQALLDACFALGCTTFDTARVYGPTDRFLGDWMASRGVQDQVVILGKGAHHGERQRVTPADIIEDLDVSLRELQVDKIDIFVLHRDDPTQPVGPIVETLNEQMRAGKIGAFGGSNWTHTRIAEANAYAAAHGLTPFVLTNPNYGLAVQVEEPWDNCESISGPPGAEAREWYRAHHMPVFAWSSLAAGFLSGRITRANHESVASEFPPLVARCYYSEDNFQRLDRAQAIAERKGATVPQIALAYIFHQGLDLFALVGCVNGAELQSNIDALAIDLSPAEIAYLDLQTDDPA